jgi:hypothetical protein
MEERVEEREYVKPTTYSSTFSKFSPARKTFSKLYAYTFQETKEREPNRGTWEVEFHKAHIHSMGKSSIYYLKLLIFIYW